MNDTKQPSIIVYSTTWCGFCKMAKEYLDEKGFNYVDKNIETDYEAYQELEKKMGAIRGTPVLDIGGQVILGFDRPKIDAALAV